MNQKLERFVDSKFVYRFMQNPDVVRSEEDARKYGINCISLAHLAIKELFGKELPNYLLCAELYADREYFYPMNLLDDIQAGDLVWFGVENPHIEPEDFMPEYNSQGKLINWRDFPVKHVAIATGTKDKSCNELLLHSTYYEGTNTIWPLSRFASYERYRRLYGISRLRELDAG